MSFRPRLLFLLSDPRPLTPVLEFSPPEIPHPISDFGEEHAEHALKPAGSCCRWRIGRPRVGLGR